MPICSCCSSIFWTITAIISVHAQNRQRKYQEFYFKDWTTIYLLLLLLINLCLIVIKKARLNSCLGIKILLSDDVHPGHEHARG
jgi:hypothetical protein